MDILGLVTAAGKSTRMGGFPKPLLWFGHEYFAERILRILDEAGVEDRLIVLGHEADEVQQRLSLDGASSIVNTAYDTGMLSSVQAGVRHAQRRDVNALLLWPVDYPCVPQPILQRLWDRFRTTDADIVAPTASGNRGHPALFGSSTFTPLLEAPEEAGARAVVYDESTDVVEIDVDDECILIDIDTPAEYWEAVKQYWPAEPTPTT